MRGAMHDKEIREFSIDGQGMHIGKAFRNVTGIIAGQPTHLDPSELSRIGSMFKEEGRS
jgi:circadian clock protein KaiC